MTTAQPILRRRFEALSAPLDGMPDPMGRRALRLVMTLFGGRFRVAGLEHLRSIDGPAIVAPNHLNYFEAILTPSTLMYLRDGAPPRFLCDWMFRYIPIVGWLISQNRPIWVWTKKAKVPLINRVRARRAGEDPLDAGRHALDAGDWLGIYPEGKCNRDPHRLLKGRRGLARLVLDSKAVVLPLGIDYEGRAAGRRVTAMPRLTFRFGEPLCFDEARAALAEAGSGEALADLRRHQEREVTRRVMDAIGALSGKLSAESARREPAAPRRMQWHEPALPTKS